MEKVEDLNIHYISSEEPVEYAKSINYMEKCVDKVIADKEKGVIWFLEHPSIYTVGASSDFGDVLDKDRFPVYKTARGGQVTYHGPGQRIVYIILDLKKIFYPNKPDLSEYIRLLEDAIIKSLLVVGIKSQKMKGSPGVWVEVRKGVFKKIAAIGVRVKKWVCYHGVAVNISPNLEHFRGIIPCGIKEHGVTSIEELGYKVSLEEFDDIFRKKLEDKLKNASNK